MAYTFNPFTGNLDYYQPATTPTLAAVSAVSTTAPLSLYTMTSGVPVEFRATDGTALLYLDETNKRVGVGASPTIGGRFQVTATGQGLANIGAIIYNVGSAGISDPTLQFRNDAEKWIMGFDDNVTDTFAIQNGVDTINTSTAQLVITRASSGGRVGIGNGSPTAKLDVISTTEQLRTGYDASNYATHTVTSAGVVTINSVGTAPVTQLANAGTLTFWTTNGSSGFRSTHVGYGSGENGHSGDSRTALGYRAARSGTGSDIISIGAAANYNGQNFSYSLFIGSSGNSSTGMQNTAANQAVIGMPNGNGYTTFYLGQGVSAVTGTPTGTSIYGTPGTVQGATVGYGSGDGSGTDIPGGVTTIFGGRGTGAATGGGTIQFQTPDTAGSSATLQSWTTKMILLKLGNFAIGDTTTTFDSAIGRVAIVGAKSTNFSGGLNVVDTSNQAAGKGGIITFVGKYTDAGAYAVGGVIEISKSNSTTGNYSFDMNFYTRVNGANPTAYMTAVNGGRLALSHSTAATTIVIGTRSVTGSGIDNVAIGNGALGAMTGGYNTVVGSNAGLNGGSGSSNTLIGRYAGRGMLNGSNNIIIGSVAAGVDTGTISNVLVIGSENNAQHNNDLVANDASIGMSGASGGYKQFYFGQGKNKATPDNITLQVTGGSGTDNAASSIILAGGKGTGAGTPGSYIVQTATTLGTGTTLQSLATRLTISGGAVTTDASTATWADKLDFVFNTGTGTKIGTATTQKIAFWNAAPIVQPTTAVAAATFVANTSGIVDDSATFDGYTIGQVVKALRNAGLLA